MMAGLNSALDLVTDADLDIEKESDVDQELEKIWHIFIHNDNVTPYDFVIVVLRKFFELSLLETERITYVAHTEGIAYVMSLPRREAEKRVGRAHFAAGLEGYPLTFTIEPE